MKIDEVIRQTEIYIDDNISEHNKSLAILLLKELNNIKNDDNYLVPSYVIRTILDSFDLSTAYWKEYFTIYWNENLSKFKDPFR